MPELIVILDPILMHRRERIPAAVGHRVRDLIPAGLKPCDYRLICNGRAVTDLQAFLDTFRFGPRDQVVLRPLPRVVTGAMLAGLTAAEVAAGATVGIGYTIAAAAINIAVAAAVSFGVSALVMAIMPPPKLSRREDGAISSVYGWDGVHNTMANGTPIPLLYGCHRVGGQVLSQFTHATEDGKNELSMLLGLCAGPVSAINGVVGCADGLTGAGSSLEPTRGLKINSNVASIFDGLQVSYRRGEWEQEIIPGFDDVTRQISQSQELSASAYIYTTSDECQAVELQLRLPSGLYRVKESTGAVLAQRVRHSVRYRRSGATGWSALQTISVTAETRTQHNVSYRIDFPAPCVYEIELTRLSPLDGLYSSSVMHLVGVTEIDYDDVSYNGIALVGLKALATEQLNGAVQLCTSLVHGKKIVVYHPDDDFGEDTEQLFAADGEALWGWFFANHANVSRAATNDYAPHRYSVLHAATATDWADGVSTGPYAYKDVTGDFDVRARCQCAGATASDVMAALLVQSPDDETDWFFAGTYYASGTQYCYVRNTEDGSSSLIADDESADSWFRIVRSGASVTAYSSADGLTWTQQGAAQARADFPATVRVGLASATPGNSAGTHRANFSAFSFTDSTAYSVECNSNPAWVIYDLLTDEHYGLGAHVDRKQIALDTFIAFADYCNAPVDDGASGTERRHRWDGVIDTTGSAWDTIQTVARTARASILLQADSIRAVFQDVATAAQLFTMSNIKRGTFALTYQAPRTSANAWEIQYLNAAADYEQDYESYDDPDIDDDDPYRCQTTPLYGVTRRSQALREARFLCRANRLLTTMCSFEVGIDALACEPGDRIEVQHDVPAWGAGGRVAAGSASTITFDRPVTLAAGSVHEVTVRHADDSIETRTVTTSAGTHVTVAVAPDWTAAPAADDVFAVGVENIQTRPFLVTSIERTKDMECRVECVEYDESLYSDALGDIGEVTYTTLPDPRTIPADVTGLVVTERAQIEKDGTIKNVIDVTYTFPVDAIEALIYWCESDYSDHWTHVGSTRSTRYTIDSDVAYGITYRVAVAAASAWGLHKSPAAAPSAEITIYGRTTPPSNVTGLTVTRLLSDLSFRWNEVADADLAGYEIRYGSASWDSAQILGTALQGGAWTTVNFAQGTTHYLIKAYNTSGIYSAVAGSIETSIPGRIAENLVVERDEVAEGWDGTKTKMTVDGVVLDLDAGELIGVYETPEIDCGASVRSLVACLVSAAQVDLGATWASASWTWGSETAEAATWSGSGTPHMALSVKFRHGDTSGSLGAYSPFLPGQYTAQYYQFCVTVTVDSAAYSATIENMLTTIDVPDYVISGRNVAVAATGTTTITWTDYGNGFNVTPKVVAVADAGGAGDNIEIYSVSSSTMVVRYWSGAGAQVAGHMNFVAQGY